MQTAQKTESLVHLLKFDLLPSRTLWALSLVPQKLVIFLGNATPSSSSSLFSNRNGLKRGEYSTCLPQVVVSHEHPSSYVLFVTSHDVFDTLVDAPHGDQMPHTLECRSTKGIGAFEEAGRALPQYSTESVSWRVSRSLAVCDRPSRVKFLSVGLEVETAVSPRVAGCQAASSTRRGDSHATARSSQIIHAFA